LEAIKRKARTNSAHLRLLAQSELVAVVVAVVVVVVAVVVVVEVIVVVAAVVVCAYKKSKPAVLVTYPTLLSSSFGST